MSVDLEQYALILGKLGFDGVAKSLQDSAMIIRKNGGPERLFLDDQSEIFRQSQEHAIQEIEKRYAIQRKLVDFFITYAPPNRRVFLSNLFPQFREEVASQLPDTTPTHDLLLPVTSRYIAKDDLEEQRLVQKARNISPSVKLGYNRHIRAALRVNLLSIGDIRILTGSSQEVAPSDLSLKSITFLREAFSRMQ